ncbi:solute carrier family 38 member 10-like isoform X2 [Narcine bancroftii]|uniref:solute carrier family 38 member 10-like isoform X2 n=1 Tax=Narcine bancroftii TaxID=1343680 RepID=UPI0038319F00
MGMPLKEWSSTLTVVDSIIGVSVLTLPSCYQQCGVILGSSLLICYSWLTYSSSLMLIKVAILSNRKTYFGLAQVSYGIPGKLIVEISMIGLLLGTCTVFFTALEGLVARLFMMLTGSSITKWHPVLLFSIITAVSVLPLSLQKKVSNSAWQSLSSIAFCILLMSVLMMNCLTLALSGGLELEKVHLWHWSGITTCLPILTTTFCGHPLVLPIYFNFWAQPVSQINVAYKQANIIVVTCYTVVGLSGYLSYIKSVPRDILAALPPSLVTDGIFLISLISSFPLIILPCRQAINTLLFEQQKEDGTFSVSGDMPFHRHVTCTVLIVYCTMVMGVLAPNVHSTLAVMGTTTASVICFISPSAIYAKLHKDTLRGRHNNATVLSRSRPTDSRWKSQQGKHKALLYCKTMIVLGVGILLLFIRASSISELTEVEFLQQPIRKSLGAEGIGNANLTNRTKDEGVVEHHRPTAGGNLCTCKSVRGQDNTWPTFNQSA